MRLRLLTNCIRTDHLDRKCCTPITWWDNPQVSVGDHVCGVVKYEMGLLYYEFDCGGATGQYVSVRKEGLLAVCEIVVHAPQ